jgi:hypothetical protein
MSQSTSEIIRQIMPIFSDMLSRSSLRVFLADITQVKFYWRALTPMVILWGFIYQRLNAEHTCDAYVDYVLAGGVDELDPADPHQEPLSKRLRSESTSAYVQGRNRLPLEVLEWARQTVHQETETWLAGFAQWKGYYVRLLDGTTFRMRPYGDLAERYGQSNNQYGFSYWVIVRAIAAFDLMSQTVVSITVAPFASGENHLVWDLLQQEPSKKCIYIGDRIFGIYSVMQTFRAVSQDAIVRLMEARARAIVKRVGQRPLQPGESRLIDWQPSRQDQSIAHLPTTPVSGRLLYIRLTKPGFRPLDIYLFTTLLDDERYPLVELCALYQQRWQVEVDFRHLKTTMDMETFDVRSANLFRKELEAGLLAYNLVRALMCRAARTCNVEPVVLSFSRCLRRIRHFILEGGPRWLDRSGSMNWLVMRLAKCKLPKQPNKVPFEPRAVRKPPFVYPYLRGDRALARQEVLDHFTIS